MTTADVTREDFQLWAEHPVTAWVARACGVQAKELQDQWLEQSWVRGSADADTLVRMRAQAETLQVIADPNYESVCELHGQEPANG